MLLHKSSKIECIGASVELEAVMGFRYFCMHAAAAQKDRRQV